MKPVREGLALIFRGSPAAFSERPPARRPPLWAVRKADRASHRAREERQAHHSNRPLKEEKARPTGACLAPVTS
jgi:hypothetical protein